MGKLCFPLLTEHNAVQSGHPICIFLSLLKRGHVVKLSAVHQIRTFAIELLLHLEGAFSTMDDGKG